MNFPVFLQGTLIKLTEFVVPTEKTEQEERDGNLFVLRILLVLSRDKEITVKFNDIMSFSTADVIGEVDQLDKPSRIGGSSL